MERDIRQVLYDEATIATKVEELGQAITKDYQGKNLVVIGVLKGANVFMGDLIRKVTIPMTLDFIAVSSYGHATESSGVVRFLKDLDHDIEGKDILLVEDIIDTGLTLHYLISVLRERRPASMAICTLFDKPARRKVDIPVHYKGFDIPDEFIVGYGIDYAEQYRNLPYVGVLKEEVYGQ